MPAGAESRPAIAPQRGDAVDVALDLGDDVAIEDRAHVHREMPP